MSDGFGGDGFIGVGQVDNGSPPTDAGLVVLQTTAGIANGNSYIDIAYLYGYADQVGFQIAATETGSSTEQAILRAMVPTEARQAEFFGDRSTATQFTAFPRTGVYAAHARTAFIPEEVKRAQAAYALAQLSFNAATDNDEIHQGQVKKYRVKTDKVEEEIEYTGGAERLSDYGHAKAKGDDQIAAIIANSVTGRNASHPLWVA